MSRFTESVVEETALAWLEPIGWQVAHGPDIAPPCLPAGRDMPAAERADYGEVTPTRRLRDTLARLNERPDLNRCMHLAISRGEKWRSVDRHAFNQPNRHLLNQPTPIPRPGGMPGPPLTCPWR